jgi:MFS family permease
VTTTRRPEASATRRLRQARIAVALLFLIAGAAVGIWTARMPTIEARLRLTHPQLSIALFALAIGGLAGMTLAGRLVDRYGSAPVAARAALVLGPALLVVSWAPQLPALIVALLLFGLVHGLLNVAMNANAVGCQDAYQRPIMTSFHAAFSIGGLLGAAVGGGFADADPTAAATFTTTAVLTLALAGCSARWIRPNPAPATSHRASTSAAPAAGESRTSWRRIAALGAIAFGALLCEGATADWSSIYLHDSLRSSPQLAAAGYAVFALLMTAGRLTGDRLVTAFGPVTVIRVCGLLAATGFTVGLLVGTPAAAIVGYGCLGAGLSCIVPQIYSAAGTLDTHRNGRTLARVAAIGYGGFVTGPPVIGAAGSAFGLPTAMLILPGMTVLAVAGAGLVRHPADRRAPTPS